MYETASPQSCKSDPKQEIPKISFPAENLAEIGIWE
jgi:hypothetical protein